MCFYVTFGSVKSLNNSIVCFMKIIKEEVSVNCLIFTAPPSKYLLVATNSRGAGGTKERKKKRKHTSDFELRGSLSNDSS